MCMLITLKGQNAFNDAHKTPQKVKRRERQKHEMNIKR